MKKLRRLPWAESEPYMVRCLLKAVKGRFGAVPLVASLASGLNRYHPSLGVAMVDEVLEEVTFELLKGCNFLVRSHQKLRVPPFEWRSCSLSLG